jgi:thymidylate synthase
MRWRLPLATISCMKAETMNIEHSYLSILHEAMMQGDPTPDRTGVGTVGLFGVPMVHGMNRGFPLLTTKKMPFKNTFRELMWFLSGSTNVNDLHPSCHKWWTPWADEDGNLGPIYGEQLRNNSGHFDQLANLLKMIKEDPYSRRLIMSTWSPSQIGQMRLPPCHGLVTQFKCFTDGTMSLSMYQRSADLFIGVPVNIASYALLLFMVAKVSGFKPRELIITLGDAHVYNNHLDVVSQQLKRTCFPFPTLELDMPPGETALERLLNFDESHLHLSGYKSHGPLHGDLAV